MNIETLQKEMITAMKNKDKIRKDTISSLVSAVKKAAIDNKCKDDITEKLVDQVLLKEEKTMLEMIDTCPVDRVDTLNEYNQKLTIIKEFTPVLIANADEIEKMVKNIGVELIKKNMGTIMKELKSKNVDMKAAKDIVNQQDLGLQR